MALPLLAIAAITGGLGALGKLNEKNQIDKYNRDLRKMGNDYYQKGLGQSIFNSKLANQGYKQNIVLGGEEGIRSAQQAYNNALGMSNQIYNDSIKGRQDILNKQEKTLEWGDVIQKGLVDFGSAYLSGIMYGDDFSKNKIKDITIPGTTDNDPAKQLGMSLYKQNLRFNMQSNYPNWLSLSKNFVPQGVGQQLSFNKIKF